MGHGLINGLRAVVVVASIAGVGLAADQPSEADKNAGGKNSGSLVKRITVSSPVDAPEETHYMHARAGVIPPGEAGAPEDKPLIVLTAQRKESRGIHMFHGYWSMWSDDLGETWHGPKKQAGLTRRYHETSPRGRNPGGEGLYEVPCDMTPKYHAASGTLVSTGATFWISPHLEEDLPNGPSDTSYATYNPKTHEWNRWKKLEMPQKSGYYYSRAGCTQRVDKSDGDILLPFYFGGSNDTLSNAGVALCDFDGETLTFNKRGNAMTRDFGRGFSEPSLTEYKGRYYLTLRNNKRGYVAVSDDGLNFSEPKRWKFDDGELLGSYNTQQHWITHSDGLYLAYTRKGANNSGGGIFRHRAPLFMAKVNPQTQRVIRATERIVLPKKPRGFGNFGVTHITPNQTWVTAGRRTAQPGTPSIYIARIHWRKPNRQVSWSKD
jgi:hypothetical protein